MRFWLTILVLFTLLLIFSGCERKFTVDQKEYKAAVERYCANCGGLSAAFINEYGQEINCKDGTHLSQHFVDSPRNLVLGDCK